MVSRDWLPRVGESPSQQHPIEPDDAAGWLFDDVIVILEQLDNDARLSPPFGGVVLNQDGLVQFQLR